MRKRVEGPERKQETAAPANDSTQANATQDEPKEGPCGLPAKCVVL